MRRGTRVRNSLSYPDNERQGLRVRKERRVEVVRYPRKGEQARQQRRLLVKAIGSTTKATECKSRQDLEPGTRDYLQAGRPHKQELGVR